MLRKPWAGLNVNVGNDYVALFNVSVRIELGNGETILFWEDPWIGGLCDQAIAPDLLPLVRPAVRRRRSVRDGLLGNSWASDISGPLTVPAVVQYLRLWAAVAAVPFEEHGEDNADKVTWKLRGDGQFSSRTAYRLLFQGTIGLPGAHLVWHSFAPLKFKMHAWLALRRRCWTADRRLRRGLPSHTLCPLCGVADETLDHLSLQCSFAQEVWIGLIARLDLPAIVPGHDATLNEWWFSATGLFLRADRKKANSVIMLTLRYLWLERNARVFEGHRSTPAATLSLILDEWRAWLDCRGGFVRVVH
jgi:hypothetical protein